MIAKQTVYLTRDHSEAVPEGHPDARFLLVRVGSDIPEAVAARYDGATALVGAEATKHAPKGSPAAPETREKHLDTKEDEPPHGHGHGRKSTKPKV